MDAAPDPDPDPYPSWMSAREKGLPPPPAAWGPPVSSQPRLLNEADGLEEEEVEGGLPSSSSSYNSSSSASVSSSSSSSSWEAVALTGAATDLVDLEAGGTDPASSNLLRGASAGAALVELAALGRSGAEMEEDGDDDTAVILVTRLAAGLRLDRSRLADPSWGRVPNRPQPVYLVPNCRRGKVRRN